MENPGLILVLGILLLFAGLIYWMIASNRRDKDKKRQVAQSLGFTPIEPDALLTMCISQLYQRGEKTQTYELRNVFRKVLPDGEMILFDLVDTSGDEDSYSEQQAVAVISHYLNLPHFMIFPKADTDGMVTNLANKVLEWVISKVGAPLEFPEVPEFQERYLLTSTEEDSVRSFLNESILRRLAQTRLLVIHTGGDVFTLSHFDTTRKTFSRETLSERVKQAMDIYVIFQS
jgi:hypothetical protein